MDFFQQQENARRHTKWLVIYFVMAVAAMIVVIYLVSLLIFAGVQASHSRHNRYYDADESPTHGQLQLWNPQLFLGVTGGVLAVIIIGSVSKTMELASGGSAVAAMFGGRLINPSTTDLDERKLLNVVEEMSIASGVPMPQVFVLDNEEAINAFAAGHTTSDCAITVTRGCMKMLSRDELQGVIGHEFSHILNGDMRLNIRLIGIIFGIICLTVIGRILLQTGGGSRREKNALPLIGIALLVIGSLGVFFGRLIQAAVSRQREFLADASSVQFTRNPLGLSGALQKIGRWSFGSKLESPHAEQTSHMFFGNGISEPLFGLLATHPPIPDRIRAIDPTWDGKFPPIKQELIPVIEHAAVSEMEAERGKMPDVIGGLFAGAILAQSTQERPAAEVPSNTIMTNVGQVTTAHLTYAAELRDSIPQKIRESAREPLGAVALVYGLLMGEDGPAREAVLAQFAAKVAQPVYDETVRLLPQVSEIAARAKLALANLALPGLRQLSAPQIGEFNETIQFLIESDNQVDLFEYCLQKMVRRHLVSQFGTAEKSVVQFYSSKPLLPDCTVLLSAIAHAGQENDGDAEKAFNHGSPFLRVPGGLITMLPSAACGLEQIDAALNRLAQAAPQIKKNVLEACAQTVAADGVVQEAEAELLRAVADTLDCPIPPFLQME